MAGFEVRFRPPTAAPPTSSPKAPNASKETLELDPIEPEGDPRSLSIYAMALELSSQVYLLLELAQMERYYLKDQLDKRTTEIAMVVKRAIGETLMADRRRMFHRVRLALTGVISILDIIEGRQSVEPQVLDPTRALAVRMLEKLEDLTRAPMTNFGKLLTAGESRRGSEP